MQSGGQYNGTCWLDDMNVASIITLFGFIGFCFLAASPGALFRPGEWYESLAKPKWRPPNWLFGPAWTILYLMIAISGWLVWRRVGFMTAIFPLAVYVVSLLFNTAWSVFFFGLHRPNFAFVDVVLLWFSIVATIFLFYPIEQYSALLLLPYLFWVTFAATLNLAIWRMNRT